MVAGTREDAERLREETATVLVPMGLRLSTEKTTICHIDDGFVFLGFRIQRKQKRGSQKRYVYTYPSKNALAAVIDKVRTITRTMGRNNPLTDLLRRLSSVLRGWTNYFVTACRKRHSVTWAPTHGVAWSTGCAANIPVPTGNGSDGATYQGGGQRKETRRSSTRQRFRSPATATEERTSPHHGSRRRSRPLHEPGDMDQWRAGCWETRMSGSEERARETSGSKDRKRALARLLRRQNRPSN